MSFKEMGVLNIERAREDIKSQALDKWSKVAKPLGSLGALEDMVTKICAMVGSTSPSISKRAVVVFCADNGVVEEGVTQTGSDVTGIVAKNICLGKASICTMSRVSGTDVIPVDMGMIKALDDDGIIDMRIGKGTKNMTKEPAMTGEEAERAIECGIKLALELSEKGYEMFATGEMGIGNTTTSSAVACVLTDKAPEIMTGVGAGLSREGINRKIRAIEKSIELHKPDKNNAIDVIAKVGGFDIAGMTGFFLGCGICKKPCLIDGFISSVAALCAVRINPHIIDYILPSHMSDEPASKFVLDELGLNPIILANMRLGEGTGAVTLIPILDMALAIFNDGDTFEEINMDAYVPLS